MTDIEAMANVAEIAGGVAILVSLMYAGYQFQQSNRLAKAENMRTLLDSSFIDHYDFAVIARALHNFDDLSLQEKQEFHRYMWRLLAQYRMIMDTHNLGLVEQDLVDDWTEALVQFFVTPGGRQWWEGGGKTGTSSQARKALEDRLASSTAPITPYTDVIHWMSELGRTPDKPVIPD